MNRDEAFPLHEVAAAILVSIGIVATVALPATIETRGEGGQGLETLLRTFLIVGLALIVYHGGFNKKVWWIVAILGVAFLASTNVRSPLLVIVCAFVAAQLVRNRFRSLRVMLVAMALIATFALSGAFMSNWRANLIRHEGYTVEQVIASTLERPWEQVYESGIDTLDGYRFSALIVDYEEPRPSDLLNVVLTFVPRSVWPDKPESVAVEVSSRYLGYETSGQYLSAVGYFHLVLGSYSLALVALFVFSALGAVLIRRFVGSFIMAILLCVIFRFFLGGSSFDIYYGFTLVVPYVVACAGALLVKAAVFRRGTTRVVAQDIPEKFAVDAGEVTSMLSGERERHRKLK